MFSRPPQTRFQGMCFQTRCSGSKASGRSWSGVYICQSDIDDCNDEQGIAGGQFFRLPRMSSESFPVVMAFARRSRIRVQGLGRSSKALCREGESSLVLDSKREKAVERGLPRFPRLTSIRGESGRPCAPSE